jgi:hypothetical protein
MKLKILQVAHHRNGVSGAPFDVALFAADDESAHPDAQSRKVAILFDQQGYCAVLDVDMLAAGDIAFGSNSWRGDYYESRLRTAISNHHRNKP